MELEVTSSLGAMGPVIGEIDSLLASQKQLPSGVDKEKLQALEKDLKEARDSLKERSKAERPSFADKYWMKEVRDLSYDVQDYLDTVQNPRSTTCSVQIPWMLSKTKWRWRHPLVARDVSYLSRRLEEANDRRERYSFASSHENISDNPSSKQRSVSRPDKIEEETGGYFIGRRICVPDKIEEGEPEPDQPVVGKQAVLEEPSKPVVGSPSKIVVLDKPIIKQVEIKNLGQDLLSLMAFDTDQQLKIVPIFGSAGVEIKTCIARRLFHHYGGRFHCRAFLRVSRKPNTATLLTSMLSQIKGRQPKGSCDAEALICRINRHLQGKSYLIIVDDLWTTSVWDAIKRAFPEGNCYSRVIVTTQIEDVSMACCEDTSGQLICPSYYQRLKNGTINQIYNSLSPHLKTCLLYLSIYPEDSVVWKDDLVKKWVAEGFIGVEGTYGRQKSSVYTVEDSHQLAKTQKNVAGHYFDELVDNQIIQPLNLNCNGQVLSFTIDYTVLDFIIQKSMEENFITVVDYAEKITELPDRVRRLSLKFGDAKHGQVPRNLTVSQVRSLTFSGFFKCVPSIVEYWLLRVLILDVWSDQDKEILDLATIGELFQLRFLKIQCNMTIKLPASIRRLKYLQTLDIAAKVVAFPSDISSLKHLWHLSLPSEPYVSLLARCLGKVNPHTSSRNNIMSYIARLQHKISYLVRHIGVITSLRSLANFNLSTCSSYSVKELGNLTNLQDLHLTCSALSSSSLAINMKCLFSILGKLRNLKSLILDGEVWSNRSICCDSLSSVPSPPADLERLVISPRVFIMKRLPKWIGPLVNRKKNFRNLHTLKIAVMELSNDDVSILKKLSALAALSLYVRTTPGKRIQFSDGGFRVLKSFKFTCAALCVVFTKDAMIKVQTLKLGFNANTMLQYRPEDAGIEYLESLKVISAKIGISSTDQASREAAKRRFIDAFVSNHLNHHRLKENYPQPPTINIKMVTLIIHGDIENSSADVILGQGPDEQYIIEETNIMEDNSIPDGRITSWEPSLLMQKPGWVSRRPWNGVRLVKTLRGFTYVIRQNLKQAGFRVANEVASISQDMEPLSSIIINSSAGAQTDEWVLQVQDLAYDIQDFIDIYSWLRIRSQRHALAHVSHIVQLKDRIKKLQEWEQSGIWRHGGPGTGSSAASSRSSSSSSSPYASEDGLIGIEEPMTELLELVLLPEEFENAATKPLRVGSVKGKPVDEVLLSSPTIERQKPRVVSIVGYRGIGKTALARAVYNHPCVRSAFNNCIAWVGASDCSSGADILSKIGQLANEEQTDHTVTDFYKFKQNLEHKRFLIVIDDLRQAGAWYDIKSAFPESHTGSRVVVTTSIGSVAAACSPERYIYRMRGLVDSDAEKLFWTCIESRTNRTPSLEYALEETLRKCGGLPLALFSAANYLCRKGQNLVPGAPGAFEEMNRVLTQCYNSLPDNGHRSCFLSLSAFPAGHLMKRKRLVRRWIAEGLVAIGDGELSAEQVASNIFDEFIDRNIIQPVLTGNNSKVKGCVIIGVIRDFIVRKSVSREFLTLIQNDELLLPNKKVAHPVRRLSVHGGTTRSKRVALGIGLDRVRSLTICNAVSFDFQGCWLLRVLDLEGCQGVDKRVLHDICKLLFLKYLSLRGSDVYKISKKIKRLECLETLDIRETRVETLPIEVFMLPRLAYLFGQFELPRQLKDSAARSKLQAFFSERSRLHTLSGFVMVENNVFVHIMLSMRLLRKVKIWCRHSITTSYQERLLTSSLEKRLTGRNALESLSIDFGNESINFLNDIGAPYAHISTMKLRGRLISLPSFISSHDTTLSELQLSSTGLTMAALSLLQNLHRLLFLKITDDGDGFADGSFVVRSGGFPSLVRLCFQASKLPRVHIHEGGMSSLTSLHLLCPEFNGANIMGVDIQSSSEIWSKKIEKTDDWKEKSNEIEEMYSKKSIKEIKRTDSEKNLKFQINYLKKIEKKIDLKRHFKGIENLTRLNDIVLHYSAGNEVLDAFKEEARNHTNRPKVTRSPGTKAHEGQERYTSLRDHTSEGESLRPVYGAHHFVRAVQGTMYALTKKMMVHDGCVNHNFEYIRRQLEMMASYSVNALSPNSEWVLQLQELVYDIDDFLEIYNSLQTRFPIGAEAHMSHAELLKARIEILHLQQQSWEYTQSAKSTIRQDSRVALSSPSTRYLISDSRGNDEVIGLEKPITEVLELVHHEEERPGLKVISVAGCPSMGKTTLAKALYGLDSIREMFSVRIWVGASGCSSAQDLLNMIIRQDSNVHIPPTATRQTTWNLLKDKRFFLVIDDLREARLWSELITILSSFSETYMGSLIIVTTSFQSVAATCSPERYVYRMRGIGHSEESEKLLLYRKTSIPTNYADYAALKERIRKYDGLPLAVINLSDTLDMHSSHLPVQLGAFNEMNRVLMQCFDTLPDKTILCLLSLSIFPNGHLINRKSLIRRWIAEGMVVVADDGKSAEQVAADRLEDLIDRFIIEPAGLTGKAKRCRVHGALLEVIATVSVSNNLITLIRRGEPPSLVKGKGARILSIHGDTSEGPRAAMDRIRSLTIFDGVAFDFKRCTYLRVLDLECCKGLDERVLAGICKLMLLRYLSLRGSDANCIPKEIKQLECLETLDVRETPVKELPMEAIMLPRLAHLFGRFKLPRELRDVEEHSKVERFLREESRLQTLSGFVIAENNDVFEPILLHMQSLKKVKIWCEPGLSSDLEHLLVSSLNKHFMVKNALESLSIDFGSSYMGIFFEQITEGADYCILNSIKLRGMQTKLSNFITSVASSLSELQLSSTGLTLEQLSLLQQLHRLLYLKLVEDGVGFRGDTFVVESGGFPMLQRLCFEAPKLPLVRIGQGAMRSLTSLQLLCPQLYMWGTDVHENTSEIRFISKRWEIERLDNLNEVVLHGSVGDEEFEVWKERARSHRNWPKVSRKQ